MILKCVCQVFVVDGSHGAHQTSVGRRGILQFGWPSSVPSSPSLGSCRSGAAGSNHLAKHLAHDTRLSIEKEGAGEQQRLQCSQSLKWIQRDRAVRYAAVLFESSAAWEELPYIVIYLLLQVQRR